jgi:hypothetical protein
LAEEYRTFYGQAALDDFVRDHIRDEGWAPSSVHKSLLELPWSDVLTTNYDTLSLEVEAGLEAVVVWEALARNTGTNPPSNLIERIVAAFEARRSVGLQSLISAVGRLLDASALSPSQADRLDAPLGDLIVETEYNQIGWSSREAVSVSLVRREGVRLAKKLRLAGIGGENGGRWLELAASDPLPEVRHALSALMSD